KPGDQAHPPRADQLLQMLPESAAGGHLVGIAAAIDLRHVLAAHHPERRAGAGLLAKLHEVEQYVDRGVAGTDDGDALPRVALALSAEDVGHAVSQAFAKRGLTDRRQAARAERV